MSEKKTDCLTSLEQHEAEKITGGGGDNDYELEWLDPALLEELKKKKEGSN